MTYKTHLKLYFKLTDTLNKSRTNYWGKTTQAETELYHKISCQTFRYHLVIIVIQGLLLNYL